LGGNIGNLGNGPLKYDVNVGLGVAGSPLSGNLTATGGLSNTIGGSLSLQQIGNMTANAVSTAWNAWSNAVDLGF
jgi:hypothetical protein